MVSYIGSATGTTTATIPAHAVGDFLTAWAYHEGGVVYATVPAGWTSVFTLTDNGTNTGVIAFKQATSTSDTSGTWTNATSLSISVYRPTSGKVLWYGAGAGNSGSSITVSYPSFVLVEQDNTSWLQGFAGINTTDTSLQTAPTGMVNRSSRVGTDEIATHDSNGTATTWAGATVSIGGTSGPWLGVATEIRETSPDKSGSWTHRLTGGGTFSGGDRIFTRSNGVRTFSVDTWASGKHYFEVTALNVTTTGTFFIGSFSEDLTVGAYYVAGGIARNMAGTSLGSMPTYTTNDIIGVAVDQTNGKIWFRKNGGIWNNSATANPATNVGGFTLAAGTLFSACQLPASGNSVKLNTGPLFAASIPSGFSDWFTNGDVQALPTGQSVTASVGTVAAHGKANVSPTGNVLTFFPGTVTVTFNTNVSVPVTGSAATVSVGTVAPAYGYAVSVGGLSSMTASVGSVTEKYGFSVPVTGQSATASVGSVLAGVVTNVNASGNQVTASLGNVTLVTNSVISVTGNAMTISLGDVSERFGYRVTGLSMTASVGTVEVINWHEIPNVPSIWTQVVTE